MIVDTVTLAAVAGLSPSQVRRQAKRGVIQPYRIRVGLNGRPSQWFDLDTSLEALAKVRPMRLTDH